MVAIGLDYGTSHCAAGLAVPGRAPRLLPLGPASATTPATLMPSLLWAPNVRFELDYDRTGRLRTDTARFQNLAFGDAALERYLEAPEQGYYVKSPKSFLGAPGLAPEVRERFVRLVAAMMAEVRRCAEQALDEPVTAATIGRPVNFQGPSGSVENETALGMLRAAAAQAGIDEVAFLYEPLAAALEYEARLNGEERVLVVDIGGGTTDCSFVRVGPDHAGGLDRSGDVLGHSGERIGGNDYDQALAFTAAVPELGWQEERRDGLPVPNHYFVDAISINDVNAQARFYAAATGERLEELVGEIDGPSRLPRLLELFERRGSYRLLRAFERGKIALSETAAVSVALDFFAAPFSVAIDQDGLHTAVTGLLEHLRASVRETLKQAGTEPDAVYLTGGMAQSPVVRRALEAVLGEVPVLDSDHFASVTEGLSLDASKRFAA